MIRAAQGMPGDRLGRRGRSLPDAARTCSRSRYQLARQHAASASTTSTHARARVTVPVDGDRLASLLGDEELRRLTRALRVDLDAYDYRWYRVGTPTRR